MAEKAKPGIYEARVVDYGISKTKKGEPMAMVRFSFFDEDNDGHQMNWYGTFVHPKAAEISCEALAVCGWTTNDPADLAKGTGSGVLDEEALVSITLKVEEYNGEKRTKIAYINPVGGAGFRDSLAHGEAVQMFSGLNLGGVAAAARQKHAPAKPKNFAPGADNEATPF